jgi:hypothetical protein
MRERKRERGGEREREREREDFRVNLPFAELSFLTAIIHPFPSAPTTYYYATTLARHEKRFSANQSDLKLSEVGKEEGTSTAFPEICACPGDWENSFVAIEDAGAFKLSTNSLLGGCRHPRVG